jgi:hypothetical protein
VETSVAEDCVIQYSGEWDEVLETTHNYKILLDDFAQYGTSCGGSWWSLQLGV